MLIQSGFILLASLAQQPATPGIPPPSYAGTHQAAIASREDTPHSRPVLVLQVNPEVSEEARAKHLSGTIQLSLEVDNKGVPQHVIVTRGVGYGMDEKAAEAVRKYRYKPALAGDGTPISAQTSVAVTFQLF